MQEWISFVDFNVLLNRTLQHSNQAMLQSQAVPASDACLSEGSTSYVIAEIGVELPVYTKISDSPNGRRELFLRLPQPAAGAAISSSESEMPLSSIKLILKPTLTCNAPEISQ